MSKEYSQKNKPKSLVLFQGLLLLALVLSLAWVGYRVHKTESVVDQLQVLGGGVDATYFEGFGSEIVMFNIYVPGQEPRRFSKSELALVASTVDNLTYFSYLYDVDVSHTNIPPAILIKLVKILDLQEITADNSEMNDDVLAAIPQSSNLEKIYARDTNVTEEGVQALLKRKNIIIYR